MREKPKDKTRLAHILEAIDNLHEFTQGVTFEQFCENKILKFAVIKNLEIIGESAYMLTKEFIVAHNDINWSAIISMRHVLVHGYYNISERIVWSTIENDLQPLKNRIEQIYNEEKA